MAPGIDGNCRRERMQLCTHRIWSYSITTSAQASVDGMAIPSALAMSRGIIASIVVGLYARSHQKTYI